MIEKKTLLSKPKYKFVKEERICSIFEFCLTITDKKRIISVFEYDDEWKTISKEPDDRYSKYSYLSFQYEN